MKPTSLKKNDQVSISYSIGNFVTGIFKERIPRQSGRKAYSIFQVQEYVGLNGPNDEGTIIMTDYDVSRKCNLVENNDDENEYTCSRCGSLNCDGLKNCDICGEDTLCDKALCLRCEEQERIDEITSEPDFYPSYYR